MFDNDQNSGCIRTIGIILVLAVILVGGYFMRACVIAEKAAVGVAERTFDPDNIISTYEGFKNLHRDILASDNQIETAKQGVKEAESVPVDKRDFRDKEEISRQRTILQGLRNHRDSQVAKYNADARKANRNIFMGSDVPEQIKVDRTTDKSIGTTLADTSSSQ